MLLHPIKTAPGTLAAWSAALAGGRLAVVLQWPAAGCQSKGVPIFGMAMFVFHADGVFRTLYTAVASLFKPSLQLEHHVYPPLPFQRSFVLSAAALPQLSIVPGRQVLAVIDGFASDGMQSCTGCCLGEVSRAASTAVVACCSTHGVCILHRLLALYFVIAALLPWLRLD